MKLWMIYGGLFDLDNKLERKKELLLIPMFASFLVYSLNNEVLVTSTFGILTIIYVLSSISVEGFNRYTIFSVLTLLSVCIDLEVSAYVTWSLLLIWGIVHYICKPKENNEVYKEIECTLYENYKKQPREYVWS